MRIALVTGCLVVLVACGDSAALEQRIAELEAQLTTTSEASTSTDGAPENQPDTTSSTTPATSAPEAVYGTDLREHPIELSLDEASRHFGRIRFNGVFPVELKNASVDTTWGRRYRAGFNQRVFCDGEGTWSSMAGDLDIDWSLAWESEASEAVLMGFESVNGSLSLMEWFSERLNCGPRLHGVVLRGKPCSRPDDNYCLKILRNEDSYYQHHAQATVEVTGFVNPDDNGFRILQGTQVEVERQRDFDHAFTIDRGDVFVVKRIGNLVLLTHAYGWCCEQWAGSKPAFSSDIDAPLPDFDDLLARTDSMFQEITNTVFSDGLLPPSPSTVSVEGFCDVLQNVSLNGQDFSRSALRDALTDGPTQGDLATGLRSLFRLETLGLQGARLTEAISLADLAHCPAP